MQSQWISGSSQFSGTRSAGAGERPESACRPGPGCAGGPQLGTLDDLLAARSPRTSSPGSKLAMIGWTGGPEVPGGVLGGRASRSIRCARRPRSDAGGPTNRSSCCVHSAQPSPTGRDGRIEVCRGRAGRPWEPTTRTSGPTGSRSGRDRAGRDRLDQHVLTATIRAEPCDDRAFIHSEVDSDWAVREYARRSRRDGWRRSSTAHDAQWPLSRREARSTVRGPVALYISPSRVSAALDPAAAERAHRPTRRSASTRAPSRPGSCTAGTAGSTPPELNCDDRPDDHRAPPVRARGRSLARRRRSEQPTRPARRHPRRHPAAPRQSEEERQASRRRRCSTLSIVPGCNLPMVGG